MRFSERITIESSSAYNAYVCDQISKLVPDLIDKQCAILDFGCGNGQLTSFIKNAFFNAVVFGTDNDEKNIQQASQEYKDVHFIPLPKKALPFENNTFDLVYAVNVFHHIPQREHSFYSEEMLRVLKPKGRIIIFELNPYNIFTWFRFKRDLSEKGNHMVCAREAVALFKISACIMKLKYYFVSPYFPSLVKDHIGFLPFGSMYSVLVYT